MKYVLIILALAVVVIGLSVLRSWFDEGVSGESTTIGDSFVLAEFGYGRGRRLTYAIIRSFPTNSTSENKGTTIPVTARLRQVFSFGIMMVR